MHEELFSDNQAQDPHLDRDAMDARVEAQEPSMDDSHTSGQLAQLVKALGSLPKGPGFEPDLALTHITCLLSPPLAI